MHSPRVLFQTFAVHTPYMHLPTCSTRDFVGSTQGSHRPHHVPSLSVRSESITFTHYEARLFSITSWASRRLNHCPKRATQLNRLFRLFGRTHRQLHQASHATVTTRTIVAFSLPHLPSARTDGHRGRKFPTPLEKTDALTLVFPYPHWSFSVRAASTRDTAVTLGFHRNRAHMMACA